VQLRQCLATRASESTRLTQVLLARGYLDEGRLTLLREEVAAQAPTMPVPPKPEGETTRRLRETGTKYSPWNDAPPEVYEAAAYPSNRVGKYILVQELGRGAMGAVHKAWDPELRRWTAVKVLLGALEPEDLARFRREAETAAGLKHPNIIRVYEVGTAGERPYIAMDFIAGKTLAGLKLDARYACEIMIQVARALDTAHKTGIVHRDLKPQNIMLDEGGKPCVMDFGLAKRISQSSKLTASGTVMGTPSYMAPEQAQGLLSQVDPRSDVYALGAVLYEALTGAPPFRGAGVLETLRQVVSDEPVPPRKRDPSVPRDLETVVLRCLEKERSRRYASAGALADDLERFLAGRPVAARRRGASRFVRRAGRSPATWLVGSALLLGAAGLALLFRPRPAEPPPPPLPPPPPPVAAAQPPKPPPDEVPASRRAAQPDFDAGQWLLEQARLDFYRPGADLVKSKAALEEAIGRFTKAVATHPAFAEAHLGRGQAQALLRRPGEAEKDFGRAAELLPASATGPLARGQLLLERYLEYRSTADWRRDEIPPEVDAWRSRAREDFRKARELGLEGDALLYLEASIAYVEEKLPEAVSILDTLIARASSKEEYPKLRGDVRGAQAAKASAEARFRLVREAIEDYGRALALRANYHEAYRRRGDLLWRIGRGEEAFADFQAGLRMDPNDSRALSDVGTFHQRAGRLDQAEGFFDRAIAADASNFRAWGNRGVLRMGRNDLAASRRDFEQALKANPQYLAAVFNLAVCREMQGETDPALAALSDILARRDDFTAAHYTRGVLYYKHARWGEALLDLETARSRDPAAYAAKAAPMIEDCRKRLARKP
jgi:tetratricopeptide (TPR) repeat protein